MPDCFLKRDEDGVALYGRWGTGRSQGRRNCNLNVLYVKKKTLFLLKKKIIHLVLGVVALVLKVTSFY